MLDTSSLHQATGLSSLAAACTPRIVTLASHDDRRSELPLMWLLCSAWTSLGYSVVVLDATTSEREQMPGLQQLLLDRDELGHLGQGPSQWPILPAARGLVTLRQSQTQSDAPAARALQQLANLFHGFELILVYAPATSMGKLLAGSALSPLLPVSTSEPALLSGYQALKDLLNSGQLRPTIVAMMGNPTPNARSLPHGVGRALQDCAQDFLGCEVPALTVFPTRASDVERLALRTLEHAWQAEAAPAEARKH